MNKKIKMIISIVGLIALSGISIIGSIYLKNKQNEIPKSVYEQISQQASAQMQEALEEQKNKLDNECNLKLKEDENAFSTVSFYNLILKYYDKSAKDGLLIEEMMNSNGVRNYSLKFNEENSNQYIEDLNPSLKDKLGEKYKKEDYLDDTKHSYSIQQIENTDIQTNITKYNVIINVSMAEKTQFNIKKTALLKEYIEQLITRELTDDELSMINVITNSDTDLIKNIQDLEKYTFDIENGINIDNVNIKSTYDVDSVTGKYTATFVISKNINNDEN